MHTAKTIRRWGMVCCLWAACASVHAVVNLKYRELSTEDGLPSNYIINMVQDPQGYVWMATANGLCRYDGYSFDVLRHEQKGNELLLHDRVRELFQNPNGLLFIRLQGEFYSCYDTNRHRFIDFTGNGSNTRNYCNCFFTRENDTWLWYYGTGLLEVKYKEGKVRSFEYSEANGQLKSNRVNFVKQDSKGRVWVGTIKGLYVKKGDGQLRCVEQEKRYNNFAEHAGTVYVTTSDNYVLRLGPDDRLHTVLDPYVTMLGGNPIRGVLPIGQQLLIVTQGNTFCYDIPTHSLALNSTFQVPRGTIYEDNVGNHYVGDGNGQVVYLDHKRQDIYRFQVLEKHYLHKRGIRPYSVETDQNGYIWISTTGNGLFAYDPDSRQLTHYSPRAAGSSPIETDYLYDLMADKSGNVWVAQENMGLAVLTSMPRGISRAYAVPSTVPAYENLFRMVRQTSDGTVWAGDFLHGSYVMDAGGRLEPRSIGVDDDLLAVCLDKQRHLWIGTRTNGVSVDGRFYRNDKDDGQSLASGKVFDILCDTKGRVWVAVNTGALCLAVPQSDGSYKFRRFLDADPFMQTVTVLWQSRSGAFFVGCAGGLVTFQPDELVKNPKAYTYYTSETSQLGRFEIRDLFEDSNGRLWIATAGGGIYLVEDTRDIKHFKFRHFDTEQGLADNTANSLIADQQGNIWVGTDYGLSRVSPKTMEISTYYISTDKLGEIYSENSSCLLSDGTLVFGTNNGIVSFNPAKTQLEPTSKGRLAITNLFVNGTPYADYSDDEALEGRLTLNHRQNSLTFHFSDMKFDFPHHTEYVYFLEGADREWSQPTRENIAIYKDLDPGSYVFHVKRSGAADEEQVTLGIKIRSPWWNTWWAWLVYLAVISAIAWYIARLLRITYSMRNRIRMDRQMSEFKQRFFMDVSHEFRTPLTLIQGSMERMQKTGELPAALKQPISNMGKSTDRLLRLINQLLEYNKMENGKLALRMQQTEVVRFVRDLAMSFGDEAQNRQINLQFLPMVPKYEMYVDRGFLDKILYNLLSNAFKYTPKGGDVMVKLSQDDEKLTVSIADTGVGVPKEKQPLLFTRFQTGNSTTDSIGIGLDFTRQLVLAHHGEIRFSENPGGGSVFAFTIPVSSPLYRPEDYLQADGLMDAEEPETDLLPGNYHELQGEPLNDRLVLVVEDDADVRQYIEGELAKYFKVITAENGREALDILEKKKTADDGGDPVELIVSDIKMPLMDGIELLKAVRGDDDLFDIPMILLTAMNSIETQVKGARFGADAYIPKPFSPALLVSRSLSLIRQRDKLRAAYAVPVVSGPAAPQGGAASPQTIIESERDRKFKEVVDLKIMAQLSNPNFIIDELARSMGYGRSRFYAKMFEVTGRTPKDYVRECRLTAAAGLLRQGEMITVAEVAYKVGFSDPLYFSRCFKQRYGMTPSKYQKG